MGIQFGLQYLDEGEYTVNGGLGNKTLYYLKVENGVLYTKKNESDQWEIRKPPKINFKLPEITEHKKKNLFSRLFK